MEFPDSVLSETICDAKIWFRGIFAWTRYGQKSPNYPLPENFLGTSDFGTSNHPHLQMENFGETSLCTSLLSRYLLPPTNTGKITYLEYQLYQ